MITLLALGHFTLYTKISPLLLHDDVASILLMILSLLLGVVAVPDLGWIGAGLVALSLVGYAGRLRRSRQGYGETSC